MRIFFIIFLFLTGCVIDLNNNLGNHPVSIPEKALLLESIKPFERIYIMDIENMNIVDSLFIVYPLPEYERKEWALDGFTLVDNKYIAYGVTYDLWVEIKDFVRILDIRSGEIVKEIKVTIPEIMSAPFYVNGHKYVMTSGMGVFSNIVNVIDLTRLKLVSSFVINGILGLQSLNVASQDIDGEVYFVNLLPDSVIVWRLNTSDFKSYEKILNVGRCCGCVVYNKKIYAYYQDNSIKVYNFKGEILKEISFGYKIHSFSIINGFLICSTEEPSYLLKINPETFEYKGLKLDYSPTCDDIRYSKSLNLLFTTNSILGSFLHIYFIDFENFVITGEFLDYNKEGVFFMEVLE